MIKMTPNPLKGAFATQERPKVPFRGFRGKIELKQNITQ
jgi:hypothetical protein